jgi:site-specific DNA-methyltransferase (adenine-specific)
MKSLTALCSSSLRRGNSRVYNYLMNRSFYIIRLGDSRNAESYNNLLLDVQDQGNVSGVRGDLKGNVQKRADILITDPPYLLLERRGKLGQQRDSKRFCKKIDNNDAVPRFRNVQEYREFSTAWIKSAVAAALIPGAPLIIWTNPLGKLPIISAAKEVGYRLAGEYLWGKFSSATESKESIRNEKLVRIYESALIFLSHDHNYKDMEPSHPVKPADKCKPWFVISNYHEVDGVVDGGKSNNIMHPHPCFKPFDALEPLIREWTSPGQIVLDPFVGGGGIPMALRKIGERNFVGIENLPLWVNFVNAEMREGEARDKRDLYHI